jgi:hypothetical protein
VRDFAVLDRGGEGFFQGSGHCFVLLLLSSLACGGWKFGAVAIRSGGPRDLVVF